MQTKAVAAASTPACVDNPQALPQQARSNLPTACSALRLERKPALIPPPAHQIGPQDTSSTRQRTDRNKQHRPQQTAREQARLTPLPASLDVLTARPHPSPNKQTRLNTYLAASVSSLAAGEPAVISPLNLASSDGSSSLRQHSTSQHANKVRRLEHLNCTPKLPSNPACAPYRPTSARMCRPPPPSLPPPLRQPATT